MEVGQNLEHIADQYGVGMAKARRIKKAVILYYTDDNGIETEEDVAAEFDNISRQATISNYLNHDMADEFKRPFSDEEEHEVRKAIEDKIQTLHSRHEDLEERHTDLREQVSHLVDMARHSDDPKDALAAAREIRRMNKEGRQLNESFRKNLESTAEMLSKLGGVDTEIDPDDIDAEGGSKPDVQFLIDEPDEEDLEMMEDEQLEEDSDGEKQTAKAS